ncbi:hypothetical protein PIB30_068877 [Stylosanthes scabra]|uniref:Uncharacterized protein n=1 Tax=Stylosanthes scabra TaxID=79078 RepID=A0ABU6YND8_9FABA|nr:hypothetical protein [Stylosanthes scabra]
MDKKPEKAQSSVDRAPAPSRWRARAPLLNEEVSVGGAPARPRWRARATLFRNLHDKDMARPCDGGGAPARRQQISLNESYFGEFTFPGLGLSIGQAQLDLYGGGTAEAQQAFSHFINFSLRVVLGDFWESSPSLSFSLVFSSFDLVLWSWVEVWMILASNPKGKDGLILGLIPFYRRQAFASESESLMR